MKNIKNQKKPTWGEYMRSSGYDACYWGGCTQCDAKKICHETHHKQLTSTSCFQHFHSEGDDVEDCYGHWIRGL